MIYDSAEAVPNVAGAPYPVLQARFRQLAKILDLLAAERKSLDDEIRRRESELDARMRVGQLSDDDRHVLKKIVEA